jgi:two-component system phosphate regulon response regulator PhoB
MSDPATNVLVVEDEKGIRELMALHLLRQGYKVTECGSVEESLETLQKNQFSLVVLDWMLPGLSGIQFMDYLRKSPKIPPVLMVTAKAEPQDIVLGLEKGADDYLTKPFDPAIFLARVKALLRRTSMAPETGKQNKIQAGNLVVDTESYDVTLNSEKLHLTPSEFKLLIVMLTNQGKVLTRDQLIESVQGEGINVIGRTVDTHVFGLRKKLGEWGDNIETIRGVGYRVKVV